MSALAAIGYYRNMNKRLRIVIPLLLSAVFVFAIMVYLAQVEQNNYFLLAGLFVLLIDGVFALLIFFWRGKVG